MDGRVELRDLVGSELRRTPTARTTPEDRPERVRAPERHPRPHDEEQFHMLVRLVVLIVTIVFAAGGSVWLLGRLSGHG